MSAYDNDPRVSWGRPGDGWPPDVIAVVGGLGGTYENSWIVLPDGAGYLTRRAVGGEADPTAEDRRGFRSADEAIRALIGDPR